MIVCFILLKLVFDIIGLLFDNVCVKSKNNLFMYYDHKYFTKLPK